MDKVKQMLNGNSIILNIILSFLIPVIISLLAISTTWGRIQERQEMDKKRIEAVEDYISSIKYNVSVIQTDISWIKEALKRDHK